MNIARLSAVLGYDPANKDVNNVVAVDAYRWLLPEQFYFAGAGAAIFLENLTACQQTVYLEYYNGAAWVTSLTYTLKDKGVSISSKKDLNYAQTRFRILQNTAYASSDTTENSEKLTGPVRITLFKFST